MWLYCCNKEHIAQFVAFFMYVVLCNWYSAAHKDNLESTLKEELGEGYLSSKIQEINKSIQAKNSWKNPLVMKLALEEAFKEGKRSQKIDDIIRKIVELNKSDLMPPESQS